MKALEELGDQIDVILKGGRLMPSPNGRCIYSEGSFLGRCCQVLWALARPSRPQSEKKALEEALLVVKCLWDQQIEALKKQARAFNEYLREVLMGSANRGT